MSVPLPRADPAFGAHGRKPLRIARLPDAHIDDLVRTGIVIETSGGHE